MQPFSAELLEPLLDELEELEELDELDELEELEELEPPELVPEVLGVSSEQALSDTEVKRPIASAATEKRTRFISPS